jgi:pseudouridine-5'-phosphate glycosidase
MSKTLIVTNGPLSKRTIGYIQFASLAHVIECRPLESKVSGKEVTAFILDEFASLQGDKT